VGSFQQVRGRIPDSSEVVDIQDEEGWAKDGALRDSASDSKRAASSTKEKDLCLFVRQKGSGPADKQGGKPTVSSLLKRAECQTKSEALEKSMVAKQFSLEVIYFGSRPK